jgi:predicted nucleic acid-binding protein
VTIHDSLYVALSEQLDIPLISADARLLRRLSADRAMANRLIWVGDLTP